MRVVYWRDGVETQRTPIALFAPCHRFRRAGINTCTVLQIITKRLVLTFACEFVQNKLLRQTAYNMQGHANSKSSEYMPGTATRIWVVSCGNGRCN